ncbi:ankyrin repeats (3 copies) domain-containing protein [Trichoderma breve]|uniref:Ankyrin repeats (3 copies) domain-containing protein n=1 Tax=Trichoderma breve TaxID=2034170 RepID=A0A9W9E422_9HYPO|nr:ankyrin repeats (3 copies) domain-containing protein [Trichoderma breve]KAJ4855817.1 ankyrin repeats (3 copies) domain-containing protein [Trichoderma breve]
MAHGIGFSIFFMLWLAGCASADGGDDFANNLASDLGPIIALFGERVVMQFMSQAMGIADCILLAVAPIGAITTVVSAIRVAGPAWLKSFIGRARENLSAAEIDVMSSTSKEACELWNGHSVVRCPGSADIYQFICLLPNGSNPDSLSQKDVHIRYEKLEEVESKKILQQIESGSQQNESSTSTQIEVVAPESTKNPAVISGVPVIRKRDTAKTDSSKTTSGKTDSGKTDSGTTYSGLSESDKTDKKEMIVVVESDESAPNLLLNCHDRVERGEIYLAATIGVILQLGALVYFGFITYHQPIKGKFLKDGKRVVDYAFPCAAGGTLLLVLGLFMCAWVVEKSTAEKCYKADKHQIFIVWLQKHHTVAEENMQESPIFGHTEKDAEDTKEKDEQTRERILENITFIGALISLIGFIAQFIGMRGLNWTASILQLGITIVVTIIRVIVRRGLGKSPIRTRLKSKSELDWFALSFGDIKSAPWAILDGIPRKGRENDASKDDSSPRWHVLTGDKQAYRSLRLEDDDSQQIEKTSMAHKMMVARQQLRNLSKWKSPAREEAARLTSAIETIAQTFLEQLPEGNYVWSIPAIYTGLSDKHVVEHVDIELEKKNDMRWQIKDGSERIEAILSLWLYSNPPGKLSGGNQSHQMRLYGSSEHKGRLSRDLHWWMPEVIAEMSTQPKAEIDKKKTTGTTVVGFTSEEGPVKSTDKDGEDSKYLVLECQEKQERLFSRDLLFSFLRAVAKMPEVTITSASSIQQMNYSKMTEDWKELKIKNDTISNLARKLEKIGFGTLSDIYFDIIVPLSLEQKLSNIKNVIDDATKQAQKYERACQWEKLVDSCCCLVNLALQFDLAKELRHEAVLQKSEGREEEELTKQLNILITKLKDEKFAKQANIPIPTRLLMKEWHYAMPFNAIIGPSPDNIRSLPESFQITDDHQQFMQEIESEKTLYFWDFEKLEKADAFGWSPLHYAANLQADNMRIVFSKEKEALNLRDFMGWTPLQHACLVGNERVVDMLLDRDAPIQIAGYDGITPMHCAVRSGNADILQMLVDKVKSGRQKYTGKGVVHVDRNERHPIHWAAVRGDVDSVWLLKDDISLKDRFGWTCLHLAAIYGHKDLLTCIIEDCGADINIGDNDSRTPLHLAIENKSLPAIPLLIEAGAQLDAKSKDGSTPLHIAVKEIETVRLLLKSGADKEATDLEGRTPLYQSLADGTIEVATLLVDEGANVATAAKDGRTPLHMALSLGSKGFGIAQRLLQSDSIKAADYARAKAKDEATPLHIAAEHGPSEAIELLHRLGADVDALDDFGQTPLLISIYKKKWEIAELLIKAGANVDADEREGYAPLLGAVAGGSDRIVQLLLKAKVDVDAVDEDGYSPLHLAVSQNEVNILQQLLKAGAKIDAVSEYRNQTPLHIAVRNKHSDIVKILLEKGASTTLYNSLDFSPLQHSLYIGNLELVQDFVAHDKKASVKAVLEKGKDGNTPMHTLCQWTYQESDEETMLKMLDELLSVSLEVDINAKNGEQLTPLDLAVSRAGDYRNFVCTLVRKGALSGSEETLEEFLIWKKDMGISDEMLE